MVLEYAQRYRETEELAAQVANMKAQLDAMDESVHGAAGRGDLPGKELPRVGVAGEEVAVPDVEPAGDELGRSQPEQVVRGADAGAVAAAFAAGEGADENPRPLFSS
jgi:hypothetical protein